MKKVLLNMFCYQCEETINNKGCETAGACGKKGDVANLQDLISTKCNETIVIPEEPVYFDYIALDLIRTGTGYGSVFCKTCNKRYSVKQLKSIKVGGGTKPFFIRQEKKKGIKRFFKKRHKPPSMCGGEGYTCPADHNLISMITWKTF